MNTNATLAPGAGPLALAWERIPELRALGVLAEIGPIVALPPLEPPLEPAGSR